LHFFNLNGYSENIKNLSSDFYNYLFCTNLYYFYEIYRNFTQRKKKFRSWIVLKQKPLQEVSPFV